MSTNTKNVTQRLTYNPPRRNYWLRGTVLVVMFAVVCSMAALVNLFFSFEENLSKVPNINMNMNMNMNMNQPIVVSSLHRTQDIPSFSSSSSSSSSSLQSASSVSYLSQKQQSSLSSSSDSSQQSSSCAPHRVPSTDRCHYTRTAPACEGQFGYNPFLVLRYCAFNNVFLAIIYYILAAALLVVLFYLLGDTADAFFCPSLLQISRYLRLSPNVAGVTLLALGNGAPDVSSTVLGIFSGSSGFGVGAPVGAGVFVTTVVLGAVSLVSQVRVTRRPFLRDVLFYTTAIVFVFTAFINGRMFIWQSILCLVLYCIYVITVVLGRFIYQRRKRRRAQQQQQQQQQKNAQDTDVHSDLEQIPESGWSGGWRQGSVPNLSVLRTSSQENNNNNNNYNEDSVFVPSVGIVSGHNLSVSGRPSTSSVRQRIKSHTAVEEQIPLDDDEEPENDDNQSGATVLSNYFSVNASDDVYYERYDDDIDDDNNNNRKSNRNHTTLSRRGFNRNRRWKRWLQTLSAWSEWAEKRWYQRAWFIAVEGFWTLVRAATIPRAEEELWSRPFQSAVPVFAPLMVLFVVGGVPGLTYLIGGVFPLSVLVLLVGSVLGVLVFVTSRKTRPPKYFPLLVVVAFIMSIVWIYLVAGCLLDLLQAIGISFHISESILAITVLAWGNSLGDMVSNVVVARQGYPSMAVGACFGGPLFNLLLGLGFALTAQIIKQGTCYSFPNDPVVILSFIFVLVSLFSSLIIIPLCRFRPLRLYGVYLLALYVVYLALCFAAPHLPGLDRLHLHSGAC